MGYAASAVLAAILVYFSFKGVDWHSFTSAVKASSSLWVSAACLCGVLALILRGLRWRMMLLPIDPDISRRQSFNAVNIGYLANLVLPRAGELVRCAYISRNSATGPDGKRKASFDKVFGSVAADRIWDSLSMLFLVLFALVPLGNIIGPVISEWAHETGPKALHAVLIIAAAILLLTPVLLSKRNPVAAKIRSFFYGIWQGAAACLRMKGRWKFLLLTAGIWTCYWVTSYAVISALKTSIPAMAGLGAGDAYLLMLAGTLSSVIPVPGGFGAYHYVVSLALSTLYGIAPETGVIWATVSHESQVLVQIICGTLSYADESFRKTKKKI